MTEATECNLHQNRDRPLVWFAVLYIRNPLRSAPQKVAQELTYLAVWLRIPLVHPESLDPELNGTKGSAINGKGGKNGGEEEGGDVGKASTGRGAGAVEDPWETWNAIRVMCEHKSW